jgi:hypothetical protein
LAVAAPDNHPGRIEVDTAEATATVVAIYRVTRVVILQTQDGKKAGYTLGPEVVNFDQIKVGDQVRATLVYGTALFLGKSGSAAPQSISRPIPAGRHGGSASVVPDRGRHRPLLVRALDGVFKSPGAHAATAEEGHDIAVFPLAIPSISGPGPMLAAVTLTDNHRFNLLHQTGTALVLAGFNLLHQTGTALVLVVVLAITVVMLLAAVPVMRLLGKSGADALSRVMGLLLASVAVNMVYTALMNIRM